MAWKGKKGLQKRASTSAHDGDDGDGVSGRRSQAGVHTTRCFNVRRNCGIQTSDTFLREYPGQPTKHVREGATTATHECALHLIKRSACRANSLLGVFLSRMAEKSAVMAGEFNTSTLGFEDAAAYTIQKYA